jgi:uncharacterized protein
MYQAKTYRNERNTARFEYFRVVEFESDLLVGISNVKNTTMAKKLCIQFVREARTEISSIGNIIPQFFVSHVPVKFQNATHPLVAQMLIAGEKASVGPMAAVAGAVSEYTGKKLLKHYPDSEIVIENGGDIWANFHSDLSIQVFTDDFLNDISPILLIPAHFAQCGICSSSATFGHSFSYGKADCVTVLCNDAAVADAYATALCNIIRTESDLAKVAQFIEKEPLILACFAVMKDRVLIYGDIQLTQNKKNDETKH